MKNINEYFTQQLAGKRVIITGGTTGIGREVAVLLTSLGAKCLICGRNQEQLDEAIAAANINTSVNCIGIVTDLSKEEDIDLLFNEADEKLGGLDILINSVALAYGSITEGGYQDWNYVVRSNLLSYMACCHHAANRMVKAGGGHIVNIGSMSADVREEGSSLYVATKSGIQGFSEALRKELNPKGIKVSLIEPGATDTDLQDGTSEEKQQQINDLEMLKAEDVALAVVFSIAQPERCDIVNIQIRPHLQLI